MPHFELREANLNQKGFFVKKKNIQFHKKNLFMLRGGLRVHYICTQNPGIARKGEEGGLCLLPGGFVHNVLKKLDTE